MLDLGLLEGDTDEIIETQEFQDFCPHRTSHWLGIDVHDVGDYRFDDTWRDFEPGMVLTVEPGLYIPANETTDHVPSKYRGIGVRIEDDVLITKAGCEVMTASVPKDIAGIEALMSQEPTPRNVVVGAE
jgi:Xaa-Pro aminopeptidase